MLHRRLTLLSLLLLAACGPRYDVVAPTDKCTPCDVKEAIAANSIADAVDCTPRSAKAADLVACVQDAQKNGHASHASITSNVAGIPGGTELFGAKDGKVTAITWRGASSTPGSCSAAVYLQHCSQLAPSGAPSGCSPKTTVCQSKPLTRILRSGHGAFLWCVPSTGGPQLCSSNRKLVEAQRPGVRAAHPTSQLTCTEDDGLLNCAETK